MKDIILSEEERIGNELFNYIINNIEKMHFNLDNSPKYATIEINNRFFLIVYNERFSCYAVIFNCYALVYETLEELKSDYKKGIFDDKFDDKNSKNIIHFGDEQIEDLDRIFLKKIKIEKNKEKEEYLKSLNLFND